ncbi:MAG: hypothetical protein LCH54_02875 [Bacteroidetes bacterium]|nr:hypothetical protein [Bacteroidota bacterium]
MTDKIINKQSVTTLTTTNCSNKTDLKEKPTLKTDSAIIVGWLLLSVIVYFIFKRLIKQKAIAKARFFIGYLVLSMLVVLILIGQHLIPSDYYANILTEIIGIALTVLIIDRVNQYLTDRNEKLHREISLRHCRTPIYSYCYIWFAIYEPNQETRQIRLRDYQNLEDLYMSDDFYNSICSFNFSNLISPTKTFAQYYAEKLDNTEESFQNILAKYASKLSLEDLQQLEFFGGGSHLYKVFRIMDFLRTVQVSTQINNNPETPLRNLAHINNFNSVAKDNFQKHFKKLLSLINDYNSVSNDENKLTIHSLNTLTTLSGPKANNYDW